MAKSLTDQFETGAAATEGYATHEPGRPLAPHKHVPPAAKTLRRLSISTPEVDVLMKCDPDGNPSTTETFVFFMRTRKGMDIEPEEYDGQCLKLRKAFEHTVGRVLVRWQYDPMCGGVETHARKVKIMARDDHGREYEVERTVFDSIPKPGGWRGEWL